MDSRTPNEGEIESLVAALRDRNGMTRKHARERLVLRGSVATSFILPLLSDRETQTRWEAAKALGDIADPASIPALLNALKDDDYGVSWLAAEALAAIGPVAAAPLLQALIEGAGSVEIRQRVHHVLRKLRGSEIGQMIADVYAALGGLESDVEIIASAERALRGLESAN